MAIKDFLTGVSGSIRKRFYDGFTRTNAASIGTADDGSLWNVIRGSFSISANQVVGANNSYPMATVSMPTTNNQIKVVSSSQGAAAALWVTDSGNWWAVGMTQEPENCNCTYYYNTTYYYYASTCLAYNPGTYNGVNCNGTFNTSNCASTSLNCSGNYNTSNCSGFISSCTGGYNGSNCNNYAYNTTNKTTRCSGSYNSSNCNGYSSGCSGGYNASNCNAFTYVCNAYNASNCNGTFNTSNLNGATPYYYACNLQGSTVNGPFASCSTCYPQYIRIFQSVANTISLVTQWSVSATLAAAFKVKTSGSQITVSVYSDAAAVTQIGTDLVYTPTGVTITPVNGITVMPSTYNQGYSIDSVEITRN